MTTNTFDEKLAFPYRILLYTLAFSFILLIWKTPETWTNNYSFQLFNHLARNLVFMLLSMLFLRIEKIKIRAFLLGRNCFIQVFTLLLLGFTFYSTTKNAYSDFVPLKIGATFTLDQLSVGLSEELLCRGLLLLVFLRYFQSKAVKFAVFKAMFWGSLIFALLHFSEWIEIGIYSFINQFLFAFAIGLLFSFFFLQSKSLLLVATIHMLINLGGSQYSILIEKMKNPSYQATVFATETIDLVGIILVFLFLALSFFYARKKDFPYPIN